MIMKTVIFTLLLLSAILHTSYAGYKLPDAGQIKCYQAISPYAEIPCNGTGQDGSYSINPLSYTDNGDGTVTDNNTGLIWQKQDDGNTYASSQAAGVCQSLTLDNRNDWRVPTEKELLSIVDFSVPYPGPLIRGSFFPVTKGSYASSTYSFGLPWIVDFSQGHGRQTDGSYYLYVRCVRGGVLSQNLVDNFNGVVTDSETRLMWQQGEWGAMTWGDALAYCEGLSLGRHSDWRLPNIRELASLVDYTRDRPTLDTSYFPDVLSSDYWSSTTDNMGTGWARSVSFTWGLVRSISKGSNYHVRCVRGGESGTVVNLTVSRNGEGSGGVTADHGNISWEGTTGAADYTFGDQILLTPNSDDTSLFEGWSGGGCSGKGNCTVTMIGDVMVTSTFRLKPVRIAGSTPAYFTTLQTAHDNAAAGNNIEAMGIDFPEGITVNRDLILTGGYDNNYAGSSGTTSILGLIIERGVLSVGNLVIKGE